MLDVSRRGRIGVVSLNRPERRNAMDRELVTALVAAVRRLDSGSADRRHCSQGRTTRLLRRQRPEVHRSTFARGGLQVRSRDRRHGAAARPSAQAGDCFGRGFRARRWIYSGRILRSRRFCRRHAVAFAGSSDRLADAVGTWRPDFEGGRGLRAKALFRQRRVRRVTRRNASVLSIISSSPATPTKSRWRWRTGWRRFPRRPSSPPNASSRPT